MDRQTAEARKDMVMNFSTILRTNAICTRQDLTPPPMLKRLRAVVQGYERVIRKKITEPYTLKIRMFISITRLDNN